MYHPDKHIREAMQFAESLGWTFTEAGPHGHAYGFLYCPHHERDGCIVTVYSTPKTPYIAAQRIIRKVKKCPHGDSENEQLRIRNNPR